MLLLNTRKLGVYPLRVHGMCEEAHMLKKMARDCSLIFFPRALERWRMRMDEDLIDQVLEETQESLGLEISAGNEETAALRRDDVM